MPSFNRSTLISHSTLYVLRLPDWCRCAWKSEVLQWNSSLAHTILHHVWFCMRCANDLGGSKDPAGCRTREFAPQGPRRGVRCEPPELSWYLQPVPTASAVQVCVQDQHFSFPHHRLEHVSHWARGPKTHRPPEPDGAHRTHGCCDNFYRTHVINTMTGVLIQHVGGDARVKSCGDVLLWQ